MSEEEEESATNDSLRSILLRNEKDVRISILEFPGEYCGSSPWAIGCLSSLHDDDDGAPPVVVFCKDRDREEALVQRAAYQFGLCFDGIVARCAVVDRPRGVEDVVPGSAEEKMWRLKEERRRRAKSRNSESGDDESSRSSSSRSSSSSSPSSSASVPSNEEGKHSDNSGRDYSSLFSSSSSSSSSSSTSTPSANDCWLLEESVVYYAKGQSNRKDRDGVDASLRAKLRSAADRSASKSLDMVTLFMLAELSQTFVNGQNSEQWLDYKDAHELKSDEKHLELTAEETRLLFREKLVGADVQMAMLFVIVLGVPDNHCGNMAVTEVDCGESWHLRIVHFDVGLGAAGVSLEGLKVAYESSDDGVNYEKDFDFTGGPSAGAYFYPILFSSIFSEASDVPLDARARRLLADFDGEELVRIAGQDLHFLDRQESGKVFRERLNKVKHLADIHPEYTCRDLAFNTIIAWKRDYSINEEHEVFVKWLRDVKNWATQ